MLWSDTYVQDDISWDTGANEGCNTLSQTASRPSLHWSDVPATAWLDKIVLDKGINEGCKTRLLTTCLPSVDGMLFPPFRFLVPTFWPAFLGMFTFAIAERWGERFLLWNNFKNSFRTPIASAAAKVCEHILYVAQFVHPLSHCTLPVLRETSTERGSRDDRLWTMTRTGTEGSLPSLGGTFHTADWSLTVVMALLNIPFSTGNGISIMWEFSAAMDKHFSVACLCCSVTSKRIRHRHRKEFFL